MTALPDTLQTPAPAATEVGVPAAGAGPILDVFVPGAAKPKGSLRHVGHGRMVEQLAGSPTWRGAVREVAHKAVRCCDKPTCGDLKPGYPAAGGIEVRVRLFFAKPKSAPKTRTIQPVTRSSGDIDKHARNVLDALVDAGVIGDDSQVVVLDIRKAYCAEGQAPGARICVWPSGDGAA